MSRSSSVLGFVLECLLYVLLPLMAVLKIPALPYIWARLAYERLDDYLDTMP